MKILSFNNIYNAINKKLLSSKWLNNLELNKNFILNHLNNSEFIEKLKSIVTSKDFSCKSTLNLCINILEDSVPENVDIPKDWLKYIYEYTLYKSFPDAVNITLLEKLKTPCEIYLRIFKVLCEYEKFCKNNTWQSKYPLIFLSYEEKKQLERPQEYSTFVRVFKKDNIYEMMKLNKEVMGFNTIDHICGVHFLSLFIARQLKEIDVPLDLGRVSGAAAGHDIGKYGCKGSELKRVPRLHYYYTDVWFKEFNINYIRNIAINHSTWDLELENLSLESLILIYSDFRVKNKETPNGQKMHIFNLKDSFDVILNKLENLDIKKEKRYKKVYSKLKDFENFLINLGISVNPNTLPSIKEVSSPNYSLMHCNEIVENLKFLSIKHNISLMYQLRDEYSLDKILEQARSEKDWKKLRQYIRVFKEYSTYLTQGQKIQTIKFLYENLIHPEDDIRRHCAELIGFIIATLDEEYRKELPQDVKLSSNVSIHILREYMNLLLYPSYKFIPKHRTWIGYSVKIMVDSLFSNCRKDLLIHYRSIILSFFNKNNYKTLETQLFLIEMAKYIPLDPYEKDLEILFDYIYNVVENHDSTLRLSALETTYNIISKLNYHNNFVDKIKTFLINSKSKCKMASENLLLYKLSKLLNLENVDKFKYNCTFSKNKIQKIFLSNLKTATNWINKKNQIDVLLSHSFNNINSEGLHTCLHLCNLLKVSDIETVRNRAGRAILKLIPHLSLAERNEVCVELLRALEIEGHRFTEYIPRYLGEIILYLQPKELDEIIDDLILKIKQAKPNIKTLLLKTISIAITNYPKYKTRFKEKKHTYDKRLITMLDILLNGIGDYKIVVKQSALTIFGSDIFGSKNLNLEEKNSIFKLVSKKILTLINDNKSNELLFLTNCIALNNVYKFISDYVFFKGYIDLPIPKKIAFFPGTFDPFSISHKQIAQHIRDLGFEVYLSIDEFSWSKRTLPNLLRKKIISMSIADELNIYIYPDEFQTNISNNEDLKTLKNNFPCSEVYIVVGSDVILNASCYQNKITQNSIHTFPHIIFERGNNKNLKDASKKICNKIELLKLPKKYSKISSTRIRSYIDENRDISSLIDPLAQQYIYEYGFYQKEPEDKSLMKYYSIDLEIVENLNENLINELKNILPIEVNKLLKYFNEFFMKPSSRILLLRDSISKKLLGFSSFYWIRSSMLYNELKDLELSKYVRENSTGRIILIDNLFVFNKDKNSYLNQILVTETLAFCISKDYEYALYNSKFKETFSENIYELLKLQGFVEMPSKNKFPILAVNMSTPCVLNLDMDNIIKEPFRNNTKIKNCIYESRKYLQKVLTELYPGELVLSFDCNMTHNSIIKKICNENNVSTKISKIRKLGTSMCVPYGDILDKYIVPNTVTKSLHTEKYFDADMKNFSIGEFPHYLNLKNQIKMLNSFNRPIILVDNLLHKGHRISALDPLFKEQHMNVQRIIVGIMSGRGKDLMDIQNYDVNSVYFIPRLKLWFNESALYPFIGGDALWRGFFPKRNLIPSINLIMPYTYPSFIKNASTESVYNISKICIENSIDILTAIEEQFHIIMQRNLTLFSLGEVFTIPRCPDQGKDIEYNLNINPSYYLKNDLELLNRFKPIIK
ncbi:cytidyltransferase [Haloimpatiens sp. FM7330]|uniref:cytidyltransferase n=1 Tax=Haloimpatiens sp. FM7330 TaxID=3298610 RepID=UPI00362A177E